MRHTTKLLGLLWSGLAALAGWGCELPPDAAYGRACADDEECDEGYHCSAAKVCAPGSRDERWPSDSGVPERDGGPSLDSGAESDGGSLDDGGHGGDAGPENRPPVFGLLDGQQVTEGQPLVVDIPLSDPDGDEVTLHAEGLPEGAALDGPTLHWTPGYDVATAAQGLVSFLVTLVATDDGQPALSASAELSITVHNDEDGDGIPDALDSDWDGDGHANDVDNCPWASNPSQQDFDGDGIGTACDPLEELPAQTGQRFFQYGAVAAVTGGASGAMAIREGTNYLCSILTCRVSWLAFDERSIRLLIGREDPQSNLLVHVDTAGRPLIWSPHNRELLLLERGEDVSGAYACPGVWTRADGGVFVRHGCSPPVALDLLTAEERVEVLSEEAITRIGDVHAGTFFRVQDDVYLVSTEGEVSLFESDVDEWRLPTSHQGEDKLLVCDGSQGAIRYRLFDAALTMPPLSSIAMPPAVGGCSPSTAYWSATGGAWLMTRLGSSTNVLYALEGAGPQLLAQGFDSISVRERGEGLLLSLGTTDQPTTLHYAAGSSLQQLSTTSAVRSTDGDGAERYAAVFDTTVGEVTKTWVGLYAGGLWRTAEIAAIAQDGTFRRLALGDGVAWIVIERGTSPENYAELWSFDGTSLQRRLTTGPTATLTPAAGSLLFSASGGDTLYRLGPGTSTVWLLASSGQHTLLEDFGSAAWIGWRNEDGYGLGRFDGEEVHEVLTGLASMPSSLASAAGRSWFEYRQGDAWRVASLDEEQLEVHGQSAQTPRVVWSWYRSSLLQGVRAVPVGFELRENRGTEGVFSRFCSFASPELCHERPVANALEDLTLGSPDGHFFSIVRTADDYFLWRSSARPGP